MYQTTIKDLDLKQIALSGQCFRMKETGPDTCCVPALGTYVEITQKGDRFTFSCDEEEFRNIWHDYFDLDTDYGRIKGMVDESDEYMKEAVGYGGGIRILKQDLWEMIVTFLVSQNNNVSRIRGSIEKMCLALGEERRLEDGRTYHTFPESEAVLEAGMKKLETFGLGYRDKYIYRMAASVADGSFRLEELKKAGYEDAHRMLTDQFGIGKKVADCVCLFGLHHIDAFPVDTHIRKILEKHYEKGFPYERYQGYLGIIQQYMFYYDLNVKI